MLPSCFPHPSDLEVVTLEARVRHALEKEVPNYPIQVWVGHFPKRARSKVKRELECCGWSVDERTSDTSGPLSLEWELRPSSEGPSQPESLVVEQTPTGG